MKGNPAKPQAELFWFNKIVCVEFGFEKIVCTKFAHDSQIRNHFQVFYHHFLQSFEASRTIENDTVFFTDFSPTIFDRNPLKMAHNHRNVEKLVILLTHSQGVMTRLYHTINFKAPTALSKLPNQVVNHLLRKVEDPCSGIHEVTYGLLFVFLFCVLCFNRFR